MQIKYLKSYLSAQSEPSKVTALTWSPNNLKLAACTSDKVVLLFDENGEKKDKFATKPADAKAGKGSYSIRALAFSPDSTKIAVAQSDNIVFVYRIGEDWGEKKVICNKFAQPAAVTCAVWPSEGPLVCGLADGKVRECIAKANKSRTLYTGNSMVVALALNCRGTGFLSGHADGTIARYYIAEDSTMEPQGRVAQHPVSPYALAWPSTGHVIAAGCDKRIIVYGREGVVAQTFDSSREPDEREFSVACCSPSGQAVALGTYDRVHVLSWDTRRREWSVERKEIRNLYTVSALAWRRDGSRLACSGLCGSIEVFESVLKRTVWRNKFEMVYVAPSQVLVRPLPGNNTENDAAAAMPRGVILRSKMGHEISEVRIAGRDDQFLVARTSHSLLLGDLARNLLSEVPWSSPLSASEKFSFDNPTACLIFHAGELSLVEYGNNNILASVRTEFMNPHLVSVRINERRKTEEDNKKLAYLLDLKTICIVDLVTGAVLGQISHDSKINWLELSEPADKLLFRDSRLRLWLLPLSPHSNLQAWQKHALLPHCSFVQWVNSSDVVVAQSRSSLCVWYNLDSTDGATIVPIKGDLVEVIRDEGKTEVVVEEGRGQRLAYTLDEGLVEFGTALQDGDLNRALKYLESIKKSGQDNIVEGEEGMWRALASLAVSQLQLDIAAKCHSHLGETARTMYLQKTMLIAADYASLYGGDGLDCPEVQARLAMLDKQFKLAEQIYLRIGDVAGAIAMYEKLSMYEEALSVAESHGSPDTGRLRQKVEQWFLETHQEDKAGDMREREGLYVEAIEMYLKVNMPARASKTLQSQASLMQDEALVSRVATSLAKANLIEQSGDLWEKMGQREKALDCYRKGGAFARAVQISRTAKPNEVVKLEAEWAEHLMSQRQFDAAISHFIEAGKTVGALEAAIKAGQWRKAQQIIHVIEDKRNVRPYFSQIGKHFASERDFPAAEKMFIEGGSPKEAVTMYCDVGQWENAWRVAKSKLGEEEAVKILEAPVSKLEKSGHFREAEKLILAMGQHEKAVDMYRRHRRFDEMTRLATSHLTPQQCKTLQQSVAEELQTAKAWKPAEKLLTRAGDWKAAVGMYKSQGMWEDALRVAKSEGGAQAWRHVAFLWSLELGGHSAVKLLDRLGLLEQAIDHACDNYQFEFGFELCRLAFPSKMSDVHYKFALALEDDGKFSQAEEHFIKSGKPKEAVLMYVHGQDFDRALAVADKHSPEDVADVLEAQARVALSVNDLATFEALMLRAQRAELVVQHYKEMGNWTEALRVCREHLPSRLATLESQYQRETGKRGRGAVSGPAGDGASLLAEARKWEEAGENRRGIETLLKISSKNCGDTSLIARAWVKAAELAIKFLGEDEASQIAKTYGPQLVTLGQHSAAAQMYLGADMIREAIDALIGAGEWGKAKKIAQQLEPRLESYVESAHKTWLKQHGKADQLADLDVSAALEMLASQAQWSKCLDTARQHGPHAISSYCVLHACQLIKDGDPIEALKVYAGQIPVPTLDPRTLPTVRNVALNVLALPGLQDGDAYPTWASLRALLLQMVEDFGSTSNAIEMQRLLLLAHFNALRSACRNIDTLDTLATKLSVAMLRHTDIIPADKAYYEAGIDAKNVRWESEALVFLNRLLDVAEAIEEADADGPPPLLDSTDLALTDFPLDAPLPHAPCVSHAALEEAREWLLAVSMDQNIDQNLPLDERGVYPASLTDQSGLTYASCVLSGWPVLGERVKLGDKTACKEEWNRLLLASRSHRDPKLEDVLKFLTTWCGSLPEGFAFGM